VAPVEPAELLELDALAVVLTVLGGDVVTALAHLASEDHLDPLLVLCHVALRMLGVLLCLGLLCLSLYLSWLVAAAGLEPATTRL
jgi:hypothetical protein